MKILAPSEVACLYCRLGWLNLYNPCKPEGAWELDMSRREERVIAKTLCVLATNEPGDNWVFNTFRWMRSMDSMPGWELVSWHVLLCVFVCVLCVWCWFCVLICFGLATRIRSRRDECRNWYNIGERSIRIRSRCDEILNMSLATAVDGRRSRIKKNVGGRGGGSTVTDNID